MKLKRKKSLKKILLSILIALVSLYAVSLIIIPPAYLIFFDRYERPDYNITPGNTNYEKYKDTYPREKVKFYSNNDLLNGYYYEVKDAKGLVIMAHGINSGADRYLPYTLMFIDNGYSVFNYDCSGTYDSEGSMWGLSTSLINLESALNYIDTIDKLKDMDKYLWGYSWGGYAVGAICNVYEKPIKGIASIAGYYHPIETIKAYGDYFPLGTGKLYAKEIEFMYEKHYGEYMNYSAIDAINKNLTNYLIVQGVEDQIVEYTKISIAGQQNKITNPNVTFDIFEEKNHYNILFDDKGYEYSKTVKETLKQISNYDKKVTYVKSVDSDLYSKLDEKVVNDILSFYKSCE